MKFFKKLAASTLAATMLMTSAAFNATTVFAAPSLSAGWNETLYAEWADTNPDSEAVKVGYKLSSATDYTYLTGDDLTYLVRPASTSGYGRVDIPGLKAGRYDIEITASDGTVHTRKSIQVYAYDRSGYAHFNYSTGVGAYNNDGTLKDNAIVVYVTDENKDTVEVPGYEGHEAISYASSSSGATWTRETAGVGNILNNNHKFIREITGTDNHPIVFRFIGTVNPPQNLTPYDAKTNELGGSKGDNGNLAITKYAKNVTIEGIGDDATIDGWGFTFSQTATCPTDTGESIEVRNLTFKNYPEDALGFQGEDAIESPIKRVWVHNNVFYSGYCANPTESDKSEGDGSCDFKRGQYYTMSYNHYIKCHKTNLIGASASNDQFYMTLHHNWYEDVQSRQPLAAGGNIHIYNTYFQDTGSSKKHNTSTVIDLRGKASAFSENNYFDNCKNAYGSRNNTSVLKTFGDILTDTTTIDDLSGAVVYATTRDEAGPTSTLSFPDGTSLTGWDTNSSEFYYANGESNVEVMNDAADVPEYVQAYAGTLKQFPLTESGEITVTVTSGTTKITDATVKASGLSFRNNGDGTYTATAQLGAEYVITAMKEGYSNQSVTSTVMENDGDMLSYTLDLPVDTDGYAAVTLTGGSANEAVTGATVTLSDGTVLKDKGNGSYVSDSQIAVGDYTVTIADTGDFIAPTTAQAVKVKTTDEATEIHLEKVQGAVSVTLTRAAGETTALVTDRATVTVGDTELTDAGNNTFTGMVEVGTAYTVSVNVPGWNTASITPLRLTATASDTASATATLTYKGTLFTWNDTTDTNTDDFFVFSGTLSSWGDAEDYPQTYDGETLTSAVKVNSKFSVSFDAPVDGTLTLVMHVKEGKSATVYLNGDKNNAYSVVTGTNVIPVTAGTNTITKGKEESHLYLLQFAGEQPIANTLSDEIMWDMTTDTGEKTNGVSFGDTFYANSEETGAVTFTDGDTSYEMTNYIQAKSDPKNAAGVNPQGALSTDKVPATGAFIKFEPTVGGDYTIAAKTNAGKITYVTDGEGNVLQSIGSETSDISYDIIRFTAEPNKTYYMYSGGSKIAVYYLGFTSNGIVGEVLWGDADLNGTITANDASLTLAYSLDPENSGVSNAAVAKLDVDGSGKITSNDCSYIINKVINQELFPVEK